MIVVAVDIGGTFTDLMGFDEATGRFSQAKSLTTPANLVQGVIDCIAKSGLAAGAIDELIHGSTVAINTLIERKGAKTGLIVTAGTRDVYLIGRGNRPESYNLFFHRHQPLLLRRHTREVRERVLASGAVHQPLDRAGLAEACRFLAAEGVEAVAVCFLHSYGNPEHEREAGAFVAEALPGAYVSLVARDPARVSRVRAHLDHGGERLYRPQGRRLRAIARNRASAASASAAISRSCARTAA